MQKLPYVIKKLDRRNVGYGQFQYVVEPNVTNRSRKITTFHNWRSWCWSTFGPAIERAYIDLDFVKDEWKWCWHTDEYSAKIYLKSDKEMNWFVLTWSDSGPSS